MILDSKSSATDLVVLKFTETLPVKERVNAPVEMKKFLSNVCILLIMKLRWEAAG